MPRARWPPCLKGTAPQAHQAPPRPRQAPLKHLLSTFFCCIDSSDSTQDENATDESEGIEMGPLTLQDYINTLEPYDPAVHGWRGEEPWKHFTTVAKSQYSNGGYDINGRVHINQCLNSCADNTLYI
ncbi:uncharacterized protein LOC142327885 [Lycorma delicatula]|uniref:uncharacterized protein LOC142327885 n=1 Tax=Lycorma delicatula TaxID=130591 RepID=UPI003F5195F7